MAHTQLTVPFSTRQGQNIPYRAETLSPVVEGGQKKGGALLRHLCHKGQDLHQQHRELLRLAPHSLIY